MTNATLDTRMTSALDEIEERLPSLPASVLRLERSLAGRTYDVVAAAVGDVRSSVDTVSKRADHAARTLIGTARHSASTTFETARRGVKTTSGQVGAQAGAVGSTLTSEITNIHDDAVDAVDSAVRTLDPDHDATTGYDRWTRADLYEKATELDIEGRSSMSKSELITAIREQ